jgi:hypothetical protein
MRRTRMFVGAGGLLAAAAATATVAVAGAGATSAPEVKVVATGLNAPKHLLDTRQGVYVVESGRGGRKGSADCAPGPVTGGPGTTTYCSGQTGAVALITAEGTKVVDGRLPSVTEEDSGEISGPSGVSFTQTGHLAVLYQDDLVTKNGSNSLRGRAHSIFGTFQLGSGMSANLARFAARHPQATATLGGAPGETTFDSDPYSVVAYRSGFAVTDAAANDLLYVSSRGRISVLARFPTHLETAPAGVLGPAAVPIHAQAVPTSVAVGPDGALYVGLLRGIPSTPGTADIYRVVPGHAARVWASGLTAVTAIAFGPAGRLLVTELSTGGLLSPPSVPGALLRISTNGKHVTRLPVSGLFDPTGVAVTHNGTIYVTNHGTSTRSSPKPGQVLEITGVK